MSDTRTTETRYTVLQPFTCGQWAYRPGDVLTEADLEMRGLVGSDLARHLRRSEIQEITVVEARSKVERVVAAGKPQPPAPPAPEPNS